MSMSVALMSWKSLYSITVAGLVAHVSESAAALERLGRECTRSSTGQSTYERIYGENCHSSSYEHYSEFPVDNSRMRDSLVWHLVATNAYLNEPFDVVHSHDWLALCVMTQV